MNDERNNLPEDVFKAIAEEQPDTHQLAEIAQRLQASLKPVRPLPSRTTMVFIALACFVAFTTAVAFSTLR